MASPVTLTLERENNFRLQEEFSSRNPGWVETARPSAIPATFTALACQSGLWNSVREGGRTQHLPSKRGCWTAYLRKNEEV